MNNKKSIRNVCILAHVDHGKTTIADILVSSNGFISKRTAGDVRYLDSRPDEQLRGITMKSSIITLNYLYSSKIKENSEKEKIIVNLIDSPGHADFFGEVGMAVKLADSAFVVVDAIEGICSQTRVVITQAWNEQLHMILVINKIDKLKTDFNFDSTEAFNQISNLIEGVNHIIGELISLEIKEIEEKTDTSLPQDFVSKNYDTTPFHPLKGNVVLCSGYHQWGFRIIDFVNIYSKKLDIEKSLLYKKLWGDFYINNKKEIVKGAISDKKKNLFTSLILDPIWSVYNSFKNNELEDIEQKLSKLNININLNKSKDVLFNIRQVFNSWMPLHEALLDSLTEKCPNALNAISMKKLKLLVPDDKFSDARSIINDGSSQFDSPLFIFLPKMILIQNKPTLNHDDDNDDVVKTSSQDLVGLGRIYCGYLEPNIKVFIISPRFNPYIIDGKYLTSTPNDFDIGPINVYENDIINNDSSSHIYVMQLKDIYHFSGTDYIKVQKGVNPGHIIGIGGFGQLNATKNVTIAGKCQLQQCRGLFNDPRRLNELNNIIQVSITPKYARYINELRDSLYILEKSDPTIRVSSTKSGEMILNVAGELHLEKCLTDFKTNIAPEIEINVSDPIVPFRETLIDWSNCNLDLYETIQHVSVELKENKKNILQIPFNIQNEHQQGIHQSIVCTLRLPNVKDYRLFCRISVHALPQSLIDWITKNYTDLVKLSQIRDGIKCSMNKKQQEEILHSFKSILQTATDECKSKDRVEDRIDYSCLFNHYWSVSSDDYDGCNMLFGYLKYHSSDLVDDKDGDNGGEDTKWSSLRFRAIRRGFCNGMSAGPLCQEPVRGVAVILHDLWEGSGDDDEDDDDNSRINRIYLDCQSHMTVNSGQLSALINNTCCTALMNHPCIRLSYALYKLQIEIRQNQFKSFSSLLFQCHGFIVSQDVVMGFFLVEARLPVIESLGFGRELRSRTSGLVSHPILQSIEWGNLDVHPSLSPDLYKSLSSVQITDDTSCGGINGAGGGCTSSSSMNVNIEFELDEIVNCEIVNRCDKYLTDVRQRKGINIRKQLVEFADKQRTLAKKK